MTGMGSGIQEEVAVEISGDGASLMDTLDRAETGLFSLKNAVGAASGALAALAVGGMAASIQKAAELEQRYAEVTTLMGATGDAADEFQDQMRGLTTEFAVNGGEAETVSGLYQVLSAGFTDTAEATTILRKSLRLAKAGLADTKTSIDVVTSVLNAYGKSADEAEAVTDDLMSTVREGKTTLPELASSIGRVVPVSSELGISFDEVTASIATLTAQGQSTDEAVTAVRQAMVELMKPTKEATRLIDDMGYESGRALIEAEGFGGAIQRLRERAEETDTPFSNVFNNVRAMQAVFPLAGQAADTFNENLRTMQENAGATDEAFGKMADTASFKFTKAINALNSSLATTGEDLLPTVTKAAKSLTGLVKEFNKLNEATDGAAGSIGLAAGAIGGLSGVAYRFVGGPAAALIGAASAIAYAYAVNFAGLRDTVNRTMADSASIIDRTLDNITGNTESSLDTQLGLWGQFEEDLGTVLSRGATALLNWTDTVGTAVSIASQSIRDWFAMAEALRRGDTQAATSIAEGMIPRGRKQISELQQRMERRRQGLRGEVQIIGGRDTEGARAWTGGGGGRSGTGDGSGGGGGSGATAGTGSGFGRGAVGGTFVPSADLLDITQARYMQLSQNGPIRRDIPQTRDDLMKWAGRVDQGQLRASDVGLTQDQFRRLMKGIPLRYQPGSGATGGTSGTTAMGGGATGLSSIQQFASRVPDAALKFESAVDTFDRAVTRLANSDQEVVVTVNDARFDASVREAVREDRHKNTKRYKNRTNSYAGGI